MAISTSKSFRIGITDAAAVLLIYMVPTLSHAFSIPFYILDPMRIAVLGALLLTRNWKNSLVLAVTLPLFSALVGGHPLFPKCVLIAIELSANVLLLNWMMKKMNAGIAAFASILLSKVLYYALKYGVLAAGLMQMELVSTAIWSQLIVACAISAGFALVFKNQSK